MQVSNCQATKHQESLSETMFASTDDFSSFSPVQFDQRSQQVPDPCAVLHSAGEGLCSGINT